MKTNKISKKKIVFLMFGFFIIFLYYCKNNKEEYTDTPVSGKINIAVDETFQPIADSEVKVFEGLYTYASINVNYTTEKQAFDYLLKDSVRFIIASRKLNDVENKYFKEKKFFPKETKIAVDAIALIVNSENTDSLITLDELKDILTGKISNWKQLSTSSKSQDIVLVFDNQSSSTVRVVSDSVCKGLKLSSKITALEKNKDVVDYVSNNRNAIGIIGVSWVSNHSDSSCLSFLDKVKVMAISSEKKADKDNSYKPFQYYLSNGQYPLVRNIYIINSEPRVGLASGFASFIASDKGQRVILKSGILPATRPVNIVKTRNDL